MSEEELILNNQKLIYKVIKDMHCYWKTEDEFQDLYDAGLEGLIRGAKAYDGSTTPGTYLYTCIKNMVCRHIYLSEMNSRKINKQTMVSLNHIVGDENDTELGDFIPDESIDIEAEVEKNIQLEAILKAINKMKNEKDKLAIKMYYGLEGYTSHTYEEIGKEMGVTREMIRVRINRALGRIKKTAPKEERNVIMENTKKPKETNKNILDEVNVILVEQLYRLKKLDIENDKEGSKLEIARSNAIASTSKTILQTIGIKMMVEKQQQDLLEIK